MTLLHLRFAPNDEWHGELIATCSHDQYSGRGGAWVNKEQIRAFAQAISVFPLDPDNPPSLAGGFWDDGADALKPTEVHLGIDVTPLDALGRLRITVRLANEVWGDPKQTLECHATIRFLGTYGDIAQFAAVLVGLVDGQSSEAEVQFST